MSQRSALITEYIYCEKCLEAMQLFFSSNYDEKWLQVIAINDLPIFAGKIGGVYFGNEHIDFDIEYREEIEKNICHPLTIVILEENGEKPKVFKIELNNARSIHDKNNDT